MAKKPKPAPTNVPAHSPMDYAAHERTYEGFIKVSKWVILGIAIVLALLYLTVRP